MVPSKPFLCVFVLCLAFLSASANAQVYRWVDKTGKPLKIPSGNSALPMRRNNADLCRKLPDRKSVV